jgi:hypothetical protein
MSRTYKDRPRWVKERGPGAYATHDHRLSDCDLPERTGSRFAANGREEWTHCDWNDPDEGYGGYWWLVAPKDFRHFAWCAKSRTRVRDQCQVAKQVINANTGEALDDYLDDIDIDVSDHRHNATWLYW